MTRILEPLSLIRVLYSFKGRFQNFAERLAHFSLTANHATFGGAFFSAATAASFYIGLRVFSCALLLVPFCLFLRLIMNALDGLLARAHGNASATGEILNELSDVVGDTVCYGVLFFVFPELHGEVSGVLLAIWFAEFVGVLGKSLPGGKRRQESVAGGKPERAVLFGGFAIAYFIHPLEVQSVRLFLCLLAFLTILTGLRRIQMAIREARAKKYVSVTEFGR